MKTFRGWLLKEYSERDDGAYPEPHEAAEHLLAVAMEWCDRGPYGGIADVPVDRLGSMARADNLVEYLEAYIHGKQEA